jgi:hypothetical protein
MPSAIWAQRVGQERLVRLLLKLRVASEKSPPTFALVLQDRAGGVDKEAARRDIGRAGVQNLF